MQKAPEISIATRRSQLALWQAHTVQSLLISKGYNVTLQEIVTTGDKLQKGPLADVRIADAAAAHLTTGKGLFVKEIQEALLAAESHCAVHSMKDLPVEETSGLTVCGILPRAGVRDVLIVSPALEAELRSSGLLPWNETISSKQTHLFDALKQSKVLSQGRIGTTSLRRQMLLRNHINPSLHLEILRGNVDSRLKKVRDGEFVAIVLAEAGLQRLKLFNPDFMIPLPQDAFIPAPAQGIVAVEVPASRADLRQALTEISHKTSVQAALLERLCLWLLGGDCHTALGIHYAGQREISLVCGKDGESLNYRFHLTDAHMQEFQNCLLMAKGEYAPAFQLLRKSTLAVDLRGAFLKEGFDKLASLRSASELG